MAHKTASRVLSVCVWFSISSSIACSDDSSSIGARRDALLEPELCISLFGAPCCTGDDCGAGGAAGSSSGGTSSGTHGESGAAGDDSNQVDGAGAGQGGAGAPGGAGGRAGHSSSAGSPPLDGGGVANGEGGAEAIDAASGRATWTEAGAGAGDPDDSSVAPTPGWVLSGGSCRVGGQARGAWLCALLAFAPLLVRRAAGRGRARDRAPSQP